MHRLKDRAHREETSTPLFFHHIPKTGGTSLIEGIIARMTRGSPRTEGGNLSLRYVKELLETGLQPGDFIFGHPGHGVGNALKDKTQVITLLREPKSQIVSNFIHILQERSNEYNVAASKLGLKEFIRTYPGFAVFQAHSLLVAVLEPSAAFPSAELSERITTYLPIILDYLAKMYLVGTLERLEDFLFLLAAGMGWPSPPPLLHLNRAAPAETNDAARLKGILTELEGEDPEIALLLSVERVVYEKARALGYDHRQRLLARLAFDRNGGGSVDSVHLSDKGKIILGKNFGNSVLLGNGHRAWWTLSRQRSFIYVFPDESVSKMECKVVVWHYVLFGNLSAWLAGKQLIIHRGEANDGHSILTIDFSGAQYHVNQYNEIVINMDWIRIPDVAPYYPALALSEFELR